MKLPHASRGFSLTMWMMALIFGLGVAGLTPARADGKVFAPTLVPQQVEMPDQRALLAWNDGVETLVIESAFVGKGTEFAWVVPLPSKPEVFPATAGTLPSAVALMQPVIKEGLPFAWGLAVILGSVGVIALLFGWSVVGIIMQVAISGIGIIALVATIFAFTQSTALGWVTFGLGCLCVWLFRDSFQKKTTMLEVLITLIIVLFVFSITIPTVGKVGSTMGSSTQAAHVTVEQHAVGDYDVALISGQEGNGVITWLETHKFALNPAERTVATDHAKSGGWFVASRVHRQFAESGRSVPAPLAFRFPTKQPVYPMRLTGAGATRSLNVELIVFGPSRAEIPGLSTRAVAPITYTDPNEKTGWIPARQPRDSRNITHPELVRWTQGSTVATWARGQLSVEQMQADLPIQWTSDHQPQGLYALSDDDAWGHAAMLGAGICFLGAIALGLKFGNGVPSRSWSASVLGVALASTPLMSALTPSIPTDHTTHPAVQRSNQRQISQAALIYISALPASADDAAVQAALTKGMEVFGPQFRDKTHIKIGDAPGHMSLHKQPDGSWRLWFFDAYGQPSFFEGTDVKPGVPLSTR